MAIITNWKIIDIEIELIGQYFKNFSNTYRIKEKSYDFISNTRDHPFTVIINVIMDFKNSFNPFQYFVLKQRKLPILLIWYFISSLLHNFMNFEWYWLSRFAILYRLWSRINVRTYITIATCWIADATNKMQDRRAADVDMKNDVEKITHKSTINNVLSTSHHILMWYASDFISFFDRNRLFVTPTSLCLIVIVYVVIVFPTSIIIWNTRKKLWNSIFFSNS